LPSPLQRHNGAPSTDIKQHPVLNAHCQSRAYLTADGYTCANNRPLEFDWRYFDRSHAQKLHIDVDILQLKHSFPLHLLSTAATTVKTRLSLVPVARYRRPRDPVT